MCNCPRSSTKNHWTFPNPSLCLCPESANAFREEMIGSQVILEIVFSFSNSRSSSLLKLPSMTMIFIIGALL